MDEIGKKQTGPGQPMATMMITMAIFLSIQFCLLLTSFSSVYAQDNLARTVLIGGDNNYPPYEYLNEQGHPSGFNVDIIQAVAKVMGLRLNLGLGPWNDVRQDLEHGRLDALSGMYYSDERARMVNFSEPHILVSYAVFVRKDSGIKGIEEVMDQHIIVQKGDMGDDYVTKNKLGAKIIKMENPSMALRRLAIGSGDCAILPRLLGLYLVEQFGLKNIKAVGSPFISRKYCFAVRKGDENLAGVLNEGLGIIKNTGDYNRIYSKWFGVYENHKTRAELVKYMVWVLIPCFALLGLLIIWAWSLKRMVAAKTRDLVGELTERKRVEKALVKSESQYRTLVETIPDLVWLKDPKGVYLGCNKAFEGFFGAEESLIIGKTDYDFVDKTLADFFRGNDRKAMEAKEPKVNEEWLTFKTTGYYGLFETMKTPVHNNQGKLIGVLGIARDITERNKAEKENKRLEQQLRQAQKMEAIGRLAGGVAHDFNNMLSIILGNAEIVLEDLKEDSPIRSNIKEVYKAAERSGNLTKQLLAFARKQTIEPRLLDLNKILDDMLKMLHRLIGEDIDLVWLPAKQLWRLKMDPSQIDQILANLCINARDAISGVGKVTIETGNVVFDTEYCREHQGFVPGRFVMIAVSDNGVGMGKMTLENLFEPFFTTKEVGQGNGLGLATVYGIVKQNKGFINVYSEPGDGATFKVYLPAHREQLIPDSEKNVKANSPKGQETILLVEDEKAILQMAEIMLENLGYRVLTASTPGRAIQIVRESDRDTIHLLITDVIMPEMDGRELASRLLGISPKLKCLFMSGYTANIIAHRGVLDKGVQFISKPFSRQDLSMKIREVLDES